MQIGPALRRLWRHEPFRRLLILRILSQAGDGTLQVGMASYVLFSPQSQPDAWAIAGVLAITLMPFTVLGPFVSTLLDRWSRRQVTVTSDIIRSCLALLIGGLIAFGLTGGGWQVVFYGALLVAMSVNRFMLAGLSAGLQYTVEPDEYLTSSSIIPTVGPLGVVIGAVLGFGARVGLGPVLGANRADAVVFWVAAVLFAGSVMVARGFHRDALGPEPGQPRSTPGEVWRGLGVALQHLRTRPAAQLGLVSMFFTRLLFGLFSVTVILAIRNYFNTDPDEALGDLTLWGLATGAGFIVCTVVVPVLARRLGLLRSAILVLCVGMVAQALPVAWPSMWVLFVASFFIGVAVQSFKICVDTVVQAHIDEEYKGRVFVFYDMAFNSAFVVAAVIAAVTLPDTGLSAVGFAVMALGYAAVALVFTALARRIGTATFEKGTEDLTGR
ncbi:MFS transporter [Tessaracoccus antarcticus]|uniref:MFS transporter n=1 Tax=Tessaracoccus antarcticus TaxID=2479848 RepID=A0A3M0G9E5_9ACTN|nr:MFS transporter [Tessaracoccus antarcticus]RMB61574.1 MFS transporter [Tessaracoccus antarcticus]